MSDFRFATPDWSAALWAVLAVVGLLLWLESRRGEALSRFMSAIMQSRLVGRPSSKRRALVIILMGIAAACFVVALMRPQYGLTYVKTPRVGAQIMFCLDVSKSMLAEDTAPNRLERAKADVTDLLTFLDGDQVGLIGFAGRASVLCPLTPDYGFFKLILDNATPSSVGRGGTRLEEPIRKAVHGFRAESDVSRVIFLITDGEDHDSHPLDAAKEAVERGVKIVAVGLGDEAGSEIRITDPRTGVQSQVTDADGKPVITRLDGETLRELALETEGVYIPAGTGSLDLKSIYDAHIKPLVRAQMQAEGRAVRQDAFQWAILAGLVFLMAGVVLGSGRGSETMGVQGARSNGLARAAVLLAAIALGPAGAAPADQQDTSEKSLLTAKDADEGLDPREIYNRGIRQLESDFDAAENLLTKARLDARGDGELRFRATYNMGWVEVNRADQLIEDQPEQALEHLQQAAGWFRDAVRLRKDSADARHNLEVVLLRMLQLRDQLSNQDESDLATQLDKLITAQRETIANLRELVQWIGASEDPNVADEYRSQFKKLAVDQRVALSDLQDLVDKAANELETLEKEPESERSPEENVRMAQLAGLLNYLNQGSQRIGQSRSQLRRRQASRGFRRAAMGLSQLKRAREQLRGPLEVLDGILKDAQSAAQQTVLKSMDNQIVADGENEIQVPSWIDQDYLADTQADLTQRTEELTTRLDAGLKHAQAPAGDQSRPGQSPADDAAQQDFLAKLEQAMPHLQEASEAMQVANQKISLPEYAAASEQQVRAIQSLQEAREQFADLRALIELAYATESDIAGALAVLLEATNGEAADAEGLDAKDRLSNPVVGFVTNQQEKNLLRMQRLQKEIAKVLTRVQTTPGNPDPNATSQPSPELQRLELASELADRAAEQMRSVTSQLPASETEQEVQTDGETEPAVTDDDQNVDWNAASSSASAAAETLQDLRRLFFSIVEHLQETAQRQAGLNDETEQLAGTLSESDDDPRVQRDQIAGLASQQDELAETSQQIADALEQQANQPVAPSGQQAEIDPQQQAMIAQNAENAKKAADLVSDATEKMSQASEVLAAEVPNVNDARPPQHEALAKLIEALQQLQPPQQDRPDQTPQTDDQQQQQQQQSEQDKQQEEEKPEQDSQMDPSRVLQAVRDREAQRRRDRDQRQRASQVPVEKDW